MALTLVPLILLVSLPLSPASAIQLQFSHFPLVMSILYCHDM